jgi:tRNA threonylcarbamoyl adenosine modification protein YeaZ
MVEAVLDAASVAPAAVELVAVTVGPGTFTGVRVGVAFARGWAVASGCGVLPLDRLAVLAEAVGRGPATVLADARGGAVYRQAFDAALRPLAPAALVAADEAVACDPAGACVVEVGTPSAPVDATPVAVTATGLLRAAERLLDRGERPLDGFALVPLYLRPPDADPAAGRGLLGTI